MLLAELRITLPPRISPGPRNQDEDEMCRGKGETHQEAADASSTCGTWGRSEAEARLRRREAFLRLAVMLQRGQARSTASHSLEYLVVRGGDGATTRQITRGSGRCPARNLANVRQRCEEIRITAA
jgi:hypothetical protein